MSDPSPRALITGGTGFLGSNLTRHLVDAGWIVHQITRSPAQPPSLPGVQLHPYTGDTDEVVRAVEQSRPDVVFHLASLFLAQHTGEQVAPLVASNILLGAQLLEAMARAGVRMLVNAGTSWQYYHSPAYRPVNLYAATKQAFEDILAYYVDAAGIRAITLLLYDSYGPEDDRRKLLRLLLDCLTTGKPLGLSPGEQVLDLVHVDDVCSAFLHAATLLRDPLQPPRAAYAVSGGERLSLRELVAKIEGLAGGSLHIHWGARPYRDREVMEVWDGPSLPGWKPRMPLDQGLQRLLCTLPELRD